VVDASDAFPQDPSRSENPQPAGQVLWKGDGERPTNEDWTSIFTKAPFCGARPQGGLAGSDHNGYHTRVQSNPTPIQGNYALKGKVDDSIDCFQERTEISQQGVDSKLYHPNSENWQAFGVWLGPDYQISGTLSGASTHYQHKPIPSDNPNLSLKVGQGIWQWTSQGGSPSSPNQQKSIVGPATNGEWHRFVIHTKFSSGSGGVVELYSDVPGGPGGPIVHVGTRNQPTMYTNSEAIRANMGYYRKSENSGTETFAHDGFVVGTTRAVVEAHAFGN
jgi:hypothetical protein